MSGWAAGIFVLFVFIDCCAHTSTAEEDLVRSGFNAHLGLCRVRIHDLRTDTIALSIPAHQLGVSAVQMDDWKVVSGGEDGLVSVWDYRMNQKLWEVHSR